jgi:hypothetical protein
MESASLDAVKVQCRLFLGRTSTPKGSCIIVYMVGTGYRANYYYFARDLEDNIIEARSTNKEAMAFIRPFTASAMPKADKKPVNHKADVSNAPVTFMGIAMEVVGDSDDNHLW